MRFFSTLLASTIGTLLALGIMFFFVLLFIIVLAASSDTTPYVPARSVLVVNLSGPVPEVVSGDPLTQALSGEPAYDLYDLKEALRKAAADKRIEAVWLQLQGAGGAWTNWGSLGEVREALLTFQASGKPVYASSDDYGLEEAGYYLASAADSVFASPESFFEFNGFDITAQFFKKTLDKLNIEAQVVRAGVFKSAAEPFVREDLSPESEEQLATYLATQNRIFLEEIGKARGKTPDELQQIAAEAAIITAEDALRAGLLDGLLYRDQVTDLLKARLGYEDDETLDEVELADYVNVPAEEAGLETGTEGDIAIVYAVGTIVSGDSGTESNPLFGGAVVGAETFNEAMREAREDEDVRAVVLRVNSPGGSAAASEAMWREVTLTADEKPVIVSMGDVAASGGYWIAVGGDAIVAEPLTITGSIGVISILLNTRDFFDEKLGITFDGVQTSPYADMFSGLSPLSPQEQALMQRATGQTYRRFLERVAEARGLTPAQVDSIAQGRIWSGRDAHDIGLVDELGGLDRALALAAERSGLSPDGFTVRVLPRPRTFVEQLSETLGVHATSLWSRFTASPFEQALLQQARLLKALSDLHGKAQARMPLDVHVR